MIHFRTAVAVAVAATAASITGCTQDAAEPPEPTAASPMAPTPATPALGYACESGKTVSVQYPDAGAARLTYQNQTYPLRLVQAASGARYSGAGVEWWIANRDGQETATLSRLGPNEDVGVAILERCSRPTSGSAMPAGPTPLPTPAPGGVLPSAAPCRGPQLKLSSEGGDAGAGNRVSVIGVQNIGAQACSLSGYPGVSLLDGRGRALTAIRSDQTPGNYFRNGQAPTPVNLTPQARAYFDLAWNVVPNEGQGQTVCPGAATVRFLAPGDTTTVTLAQSFTPCGGRIRISPMRPTASDSPAGATPAGGS